MANVETLKDLKINNARVTSRNFAGKPTPFDKNGGKRSFCIALDPSDAVNMQADGWPVHYPKNNDPENPKPYLPIKVKFEVRPPRIFLVSSKGRTMLSEENVSNLDWAEFQNVDLTVTPYFYTVNGRSGIAAYLKRAVITVNDDDYSDLLEVSAD